jgi:hypothetical protein
MSTIDSDHDLTFVAFIKLGFLLPELVNKQSFELPVVPGIFLIWDTVFTHAINYLSVSFHLVHKEDVHTQPCTLEQ